MIDETVQRGPHSRRRCRSQQPPNQRRTVRPRGPNAVSLQSNMLQLRAGSFFETWRERLTSKPWSLFTHSRSRLSMGPLPLKHIPYLAQNPIQICTIREHYGLRVILASLVCRPCQDDISHVKKTSRPGSMACPCTLSNPATDATGILEPGSLLSSFRLKLMVTGPTSSSCDYLEIISTPCWTVRGRLCSSLPLSPIHSSRSSYRPRLSTRDARAYWPNSGGSPTWQTA